MSTPGRTRAVLSLLGWCVALGVGLALFHSMGDGPLQAPPLQPDGWSQWAADREPLVATVAVLRLVVLGLSWYLVGVTSIGIVARLARAARFVRVADALTVPMVRRLLQAALGLSLATAVVTASMPSAPQRTAGPAPAREPVAEAVVLPDDIGTHNDGLADREVAPVLRRAADADDEDEVPSLRRVPAADPAVQTVAASGPTASVQEQEPTRANAPTLRRVTDAETQAETPTLRRIRTTSAGTKLPVPLELAHNGAASAGEGAAKDAATHVVGPGDSLWRIADTSLTQAWDREPSDAEVTAYWQQLIEANRDTLVDPDNPDLILPGQVMHLPSVPTDGGSR